MQIQKPTFLIDKKRALRNIERMAEKAAKSSVRFRPHFKTHHSAAIGEWFRDYGVNSITVSSFDMAAYFAENGWNDITVAFPVNLLELDKIKKLAAKIRLELLLETAETANLLGTELKSNTAAWIKVDTGYHRTGILWDNAEAILNTAEAIISQPQLEFKGLLTHSGETYKAKSAEEGRSIYKDTVAKLKSVRERIRQHLNKEVLISIGDTPSCSLVQDFREVDEIRPGNFVFYDIMQMNIGSCSETDIAATVVCPVAAKHSERNELVIYGGAVHLSKDSITNEKNDRIFGRVCPFHETGWGEIIPGAYVSGLSQEHGIIHLRTNDLNKLHVGDLLAILPVHSCLAANLMKVYYTTEGEKIETGICR